MKYAPFLKSELKSDGILEWLMKPAEQIALLYLLRHIQPTIAIEIGTHKGGSIQALASWSDFVFGIDPCPGIHVPIKEKYNNVQIWTGKSKDVLPRIFEKMRDAGEHYQFALVDGDHSEEAVREDIISLLEGPHDSHAYILAHDSFNPDVRRALKSIVWDDYPEVKEVDFDFVQGTVFDEFPFTDQLWGGFALIELGDSSLLTGATVEARGETTFQAVCDGL